MNTISLAFHFAACRPRQVNLSPRAFHLLARPSVRVSRRRWLSTAQDGHVQESNHHGSDGLSPTAVLPEPMPALSYGIKDTSGPTLSIGKQPTKQEAKAAKAAALLDEQKNTYRDLMRTVPKPVAVITARRQESPDKHEDTVAATVSSFNTVSFDDDVLVSFNLTRKSSTYEALVATKYFAITFPQNDKNGVTIASSLAKGNQSKPFGGPVEDQTLRLVDFKDTQSLNIPLKYLPSSVALAAGDQHRDSGVAFAHLYQYCDSIPVGDHMIVTAKLLPGSENSMARHGWGRSSAFGQAFAEADLALGYVHGNYTDPVTGGGFERSWQLDDKYRFENRPGITVGDKLAFYEDRLKAIAVGRLLKAKVKLGSDYSGVQEDAERAYALPNSVLEDMERYYMMKVAFLKSKNADWWQAGDVNWSEGHQIWPDDTLDPWERLFIRQKALLSPEEMEEERTLYVNRLARLQVEVAQDPKGDASPNLSIANEEHHVLKSIAMDRANLPPEARTAGLRHYFETRIRLLQIAQLKSAELKTILKADYVRDHYSVKGGSDASFTDRRANWKVIWLARSWRQYSKYIAIDRLMLLEARNRPDKRDDKLIDELLLRIMQNEAARNALSYMIMVRLRKGYEVDLALKPRLTPMPSDSAIIQYSRGDVFHIRLRSLLEGADSGEIEQTDFDEMLAGQAKKGMEGSLLTTKDDSETGEYQPLHLFDPPLERDDSDDDFRLQKNLDLSQVVEQARKGEMTQEEFDDILNGHMQKMWNS